jgi:hypothetical protein
MTFLVLFKWFKWNRFCQPLNFRFCAYRKWKWAYLELEMLLFARLSYGLALFAPFPDDPMQMWTVQKVWIAYLKDCRSRTNISSVECKPILTKLDEYRKMLLPISTRNGWISTRGENHGESKGPNLLDATRCHPLPPVASASRCPRHLGSVISVSRPFPIGIGHGQGESLTRTLGCGGIHFLGGITWNDE